MAIVLLRLFGSRAYKKCMYMYKQNEFHKVSLRWKVVVIIKEHTINKRVEQSKFKLHGQLTSVGAIAQVKGKLSI